MTLSRAFVIAEAGVNHNGSVERALRMIEVAAEAGADAVKFQSFTAKAFITSSAVKAEYQIRSTGENESQLEMVRKLELSAIAHICLQAHCEQCGIQFLSSPFDLQNVDLLAKVLGLTRIKIGSGEITNAPMLLHLARLGPSVILSTGMSSLGDIEDALGVLSFGYSLSDEEPSSDGFKRAFQSQSGQKMLQEKVVLLHCTTEYPAPFAEVNLRAMDTLNAAFGLPVGLSDHTVGDSVAIAAVARGACAIEKHFTLDRGLPGPDHRASLEPPEFKAMMRTIRETEDSLGSPRKLITPSEAKNQAIARKSLVALQAIPKGAPFTVLNLGVKRPGIGISPFRYWEFLGRPATRDYRVDEVIVA